MDDLRKIIESQLESLQMISGVKFSVYFFENNENIFCEHQTYCKNYQNHSCQKNMDYSIRFAQKIYESYLFECPSNLTLFVAPIWNKKQIQGGYVSETFNMDNSLNDSKMLSDHFTEGRIVIKNLNPILVRHLQNILYIVSKELIANEYISDIEKKETVMLQSKINEEIQEIKRNQDFSFHNRFYLEQLNTLKRELTEKNRDQSKINALLNKALGEIFFSAGNNFELMKYRLSELLFILCMNEYQNESIKYLMLKELFEIQDMNGFYDFSYKMIKQFVKKREVQEETNDLVEEIKDYIYNHIEENISLKDCADYIYINPSYLSRIFKLKTNENFIDFINRIKINKSLEYLKEKNMEIADAAVLLGFSDQSYFTKVFKRVMGMTPKEYKKKYDKN